jgi:hypothetical protein
VLCQSWLATRGCRFRPSGVDFSPLLFYFLCVENLIVFYKKEAQKNLHPYDKIDTRVTQLISGTSLATTFQVEI